MATIKPLHRSVHSSVRSGVVLFDLTRVVEELVFNSLDAGATKVSVFISIRVCSLKVVDNGSGVTRDGLVLLGERYSTSKSSCSDDTDTSSGSFGSRGEALASISDVSLLEITTKTHGSPNGYRKVLKGCKCLCLGIDDGIKDIGTTVVVRDLFYNQPIRRKYIQSSPKKVLDSLKKCILRFALAHSQISFKVIDTESEDELIRTDPSSSPLSLLRSNFGIDVSNGLHELDVHEGTLHLTGYMSGPCGGYNFKALQYVYINTQFVCKGPIHKLVHGIATALESSDSWSCNSSSQNGKRSRPQACPAYLLKLECPRSLYDMNFEPSKTYVEFKDWVPILAFVEKAVQLFWKDHVTQGGTLSGKSESGKRRCRFQSDQGLSLLPATVGADIPIQECDLSTAKIGEQLKEIGQLVDSDLSHREHSSLSKCNSSGIREGDNINWESGNGFQFSDFNLFHAAGDFFGSKSFVQRRAGNNSGSYFLHSTWEDEFKNVDSIVSDEVKVRTLSSGFAKFSNELQIGAERKEPFLQSCSSRDQLSLNNRVRFASKGGETVSFGCDGFEEFEYQTDICKMKWKEPFLQSCSSLDKRSLDRVSFASKGGETVSFGCDGFGEFEYQTDSCKMKRKPTCLYDDVHFDEFRSDGYFEFETKNFKMEEKKTVRKCDFFPELSCQDEARDAQHPFPKSIATENALEDIDLPFMPSLKSTSSYQKPYFEENFLLPICFTGTRDASSSWQSLDSDRSFISSDISLDDTSWIGKYHADSIPFESSRTYSKSTSYSHPVNEERLKFRVAGEITDQLNCSNVKSQPGRLGRSRRSQSAPPFYRQKRRFISLSDLQMGDAPKPNAENYSGALSRPEPNEVKHTTVQHLRAQSSLEAPIPETRPDAERNDIDNSIVEIDKDFVKAEAQDLETCGSKWRESSLQNLSRSFGNESDVLDISSGFLHMAGDSLVPRSITKKCLANAKVLQQVDKKFIPIVADGIIALIDQHAADERIRLEDLRQKVLAGVGKTITYLDSEKELVMPEMGHQLLHDYGEQIKLWGWICNFHGQHSRSFQKNLDIIHRQPKLVTLVGVPCILGVDLTEADLLEFLQQLVDTDGASTVPPSVLRVLNSKSCRGAIMFGDSLLPSECSLIVEELKQTSLCFQCAHGRPTTVPIVNLDALHKQISELCGGGGDDSWHGLRRHELSLERSTQRLRYSHSQ